MEKKLSVVDLFSGAGGLSAGFQQTGLYKVVLGVEYNDNFRKTFQKNHPEARVLGDITKVDFKKIKQELQNQGTSINVVVGGPPCQGFSNANRQRNELISGNNRLVKKYIEAIKYLKPNAFVMENVKTMLSDKNNFFVEKDEIQLIKELGISVNNEKVKIGNSFKKSICFEETLNQLINEQTEIEEYIIVPQVHSKLNSLLKKIVKGHQEGREYLLKNEAFFYSKRDKWKQYKPNRFLEEAHEIEWFRLLQNINRFYLKEADSNVDPLLQSLRCIVEINKLLIKMSEIIKYQVCLYPFLNNKKIIIEDTGVYVSLKSYNVSNYIMEYFDKKLNYIVNDSILNAAEYGVPQSRKRALIIGIKRNGKQSLSSEEEKKKIVFPKKIFKDKSEWLTIGDAISDLEGMMVKQDQSVNPDDDFIIINYKAKKLRLSNLLQTATEGKLYNHINTKTKSDALIRFKALEPGQNFHDLDQSLKLGYSEPSRTQNNTYKRLHYKTFSDTVTNVRKAMWIHPNVDRAISIREAARLQSFPDHFRFYGSKDEQYQQVGNAVPPFLGRAIAESVAEMLEVKVELTLREELNVLSHRKLIAEKSHH